MHSRVTKGFTKHFDEEIRFFKSWIDRPKAIGSVLPTSQTAARRMASVIDQSNDLPVLELGPGTGVISKAILERGVLPEKLFSVEYTREFIPELQERFPGVNFIHGDAFNLDSVLPDMNGQKFDAIISALPLLNFPVSQRKFLIKSLFKHLNPGRPILQMSYGPISPVPPDWKTYSVEPYDWIVLNVPPMRLWIYREIMKS
ncbi:MAG: methyltransferase domain-containing protein [Pseudomonadota bacterium]